jgi:hypothetical protein
MSDPASSGDSQPNIVDIPIPISYATDPPTTGQRRATTAQPTTALPPIPKRRALTAHAANLAERDQDAEDLGQELARAYAELTWLQQQGDADPTGFCLDQDDPQIIGESDSFRQAPDTSRPALSYAAVLPPPLYATPGPRAAQYTAHPAPVSLNYVGFEWLGLFYCYCSLPMGITSAPAIFTEVTLSLVRSWRARGIRVNMKQFKELLDMSKRVDRQTTQAEFCP